MAKQEYEEYEQTVETFFNHEGIDCLTIIGDENGDPDYDEFSWSECECCGSSLGGPRYRANGYNHKTPDISFVYEVCADCIYYTEYGQLDDETMLGIEDEE